MKTFAAASAVAVALLASGTATAQDLRIAYGDLDLATSQGAHRFDRRVDRALRAACQGGSRLQAVQCETSLRAEIQSLLPVARREEYAQGRAGLQRAAVAGLTG